MLFEICSGGIPEAPGVEVQGSLGLKHELRNGVLRGLQGCANVSRSSGEYARSRRFTTFTSFTFVLPDLPEEYVVPVGEERERLE